MKLTLPAFQTAGRIPIDQADWDTIRAVAKKGPIANLLRPPLYFSSSIFYIFLLDARSANLNYKKRSETNTTCEKKKNTYIELFVDKPKGNELDHFLINENPNHFRWIH